MAEIRIQATTSTDEVRRQLSGFSWFSRVEASIEQASDQKIIVLHEVTLGQRLHRSIWQTAEQRAKSVSDSRRALNELAERRPAIRSLLGTAINHQSGLRAADLQKALGARIERLARTEHGTGLAVPIKKGQIGVAQANIADIAADTRINWMTSPAKQSPAIWRAADEQQPVMDVMLSARPTEQQMLEAYRLALGASKGHVAIAPIRDIDLAVDIERQALKGTLQGDIQCYSDRSLTLLLQAIDEAIESTPGLTAVTIAAEAYLEKGLAGRIEDLQAARRWAAEDSAGRSERGRFYPPHGRPVPVLPGIHFLTNSPFDLQAGKTIVPLSAALAGGYDFVPESMAGYLPPLDQGRLIALDDHVSDQSSLSKPEEFRSRISNLLANMEGHIVISPPDVDQSLLEAMMSAVIDARNKKSAWLSVSFATPDKTLQGKLTSAYINAIEDQDLSMDKDREEIIPTTLWRAA